MITAPALINSFILALTPIERWQAASRQFRGGFMTERWFTITMVVTIIVLTALLAVFSLYQTTQERKTAERLFGDYATKRGLSENERRTLLNVANKAGLKHSSSIFTMSSAFDHGTAKITEQGLGTPKTAQKNKPSRAELFSLREKLGFQKKHPSSTDPTVKSKKASSRQIPVGKNIYITRRKHHDSNTIECGVIENNDSELTVKSVMPIKITFGESWCVRYYFGASVWEFDTSVIGCNGDILVLNHSDNVRFINRRRFLRVTVNKPVFITHFPFEKAPTTNQDSPEACGKSWGLPQFSPATITELAGPGLRIETSLKVKAGERILVVFKLDKEEQQDTITPPDEMPTPKIIEDIGEVRHIKAVANGWSIAVELTGLSDSNVNELIRATNAASRKAGIHPDSVNTEENLQQPVTARGN